MKETDIKGHMKQWGLKEALRNYRSYSDNLPLLDIQPSSPCECGQGGAESIKSFKKQGGKREMKEEKKYRKRLQTILF
ncbi:hypothetical protein [Thermaerobacillus caldiproteolyticus]|uniref:hypothetical protein n=1 Tax=Thermaerobacillus caldiproteolyticus TaxID=247480 RepID=UPI00188A08C9|nr:hypothetical protein [Anoxybacillus caldiproteolyticus]QPA32836.1 hypothetical protein ISX45_08030 [Anoxybacillus caldiproteolyticus]